MSVMVNAARSGIVAYYGSLPLDLANLVERLQGVSAERLRDAFEARTLAQVHATMIGLEETPSRLDASPELLRPLDAGPLIRYLLRALERPLTVQFGGFKEDDRRLLSRGLSLYNRGFTAREGKAVLIGWPVSATLEGDPTPHLEVARIRRGCETFGVRHKYHNRQIDADPDLHLVIGDINHKITPETLTELEMTVRQELAAAAIRVTMSAVDLGLAEYVDRSLPRASTKFQPLYNVLPDKP